MVRATKIVYALILALSLIPGPAALAADPAAPTPAAGDTGTSGDRHHGDWCKNNPEKCKERHERREEWCKKNPEKCAEHKQRHDEWCKAHPDKCMKPGGEQQPPANPPSP